MLACRSTPRAPARPTRRARTLHAPTDKRNTRHAPPQAPAARRDRCRPRSTRVSREQSRAYRNSRARASAAPCVAQSKHRRDEPVRTTHPEAEEASRPASTRAQGGDANASVLRRKTAASARTRAASPQPSEKPATVDMHVRVAKKQTRTRKRII